MPRASAPLKSASHPQGKAPRKASQTERNSMGRKKEMPGGRPGRCEGLDGAKVGYETTFVKQNECEGRIFEAEPHRPAGAYPVCRPWGHFRVGKPASITKFPYPAGRETL